MRRIAAAASMTLALVTGCTVADSSGAGSSDHGLKVGPEPSPAVTAAGGLGSLALSGADVAGYTVKEPAAGGQVAQKNVAADSACAPMAYALSGVVVGKPESVVARQVVRKAATTSVMLAAYEGERAQDAMTALSESADACAGGFTVKVNGDEQQVTKIVREVAPGGTDQAMAFGVTTKKDGAKEQLKVVVLRKGGTIGYFSAPSVPKEVIDAQLLKLA